MRNLLGFILRFHLLILFLGMETFSFYLLFQNNNYHRSKFAGFTRNISGAFHRKATSVKDYLVLRKMNQKLYAENEYLRNQLGIIHDTLHMTRIQYPLPYTRYTYVAARVVNNSTNKQYNYITLDKGLADSIKPEMAVISTNGVVGIIKGVSEHFSTAISILNLKFRTSAKIKKNNYYGSLEWSGNNYKQAVLKEIPHHVEINPGDTIVTSGYSSIFPEGILIGFVADYEIVGGNFYRLKVNLSTNFKNLDHVYIIENKLKEEQYLLEESTPNDEL